MTKTDLTLDLEQTLYAYWEALGAIAVEEVTMPDDLGIVDTLVLQGDTWRCFELKVTKADFHSKAKLSFVGHYNSFVLPQALYDQVREEIPAGIGVMTYQPFDPARVAASSLPVATPGQLTIAKPARRQALQVPPAALTERFLASLNREVLKAKRLDRGLTGFTDEQLLRELRRRTATYSVYAPEDNLYDRFEAQMTTTAIETLQAEVDALAAELAEYKLREAGL
ncbi:hypothetical protein [Lacticaseibacillus absianus]|uniref:hypothetical protein n=1 Tax=Lacticaseibacillus absianus TaxID=2729623 RepID=UPI0015CD9DE5|nr:hypothetical protein [Lacticaseibacillus absianus]